MFSAATLTRVRRLEAIRTCTAELEEFHKLSDEAFFFASGSDVTEEKFPYYDLPKATAAVDRALEITERWGSGLEDLALVGQRELAKTDLYELLLLRSHLRLLQSHDRVAVEATVNDLARASVLSKPTRGFYRLRAECFARLDANEQSMESQRLAEDPSTPTTALDHFLRGEQLRTSNESLLAISDPVAELTRHRNLEPAISEYAAAVARDPDHFWSLLQLGRSYLGSRESHRLSESVGILSACVALRPDSPVGYSARGAAFGVLGRYEDALNDLNRSLELAPEFIRAKLHRAFVFWKQGQTDKAIADLQAVWEAPEDQKLIEAAYRLGQIQMQTRDYDQASHYLSQYVGLDNSFRPALHDLAQVEYLRGEDQSGKRWLNRFLELATDSAYDVNSAEAHFQRGRFLRLLAVHPKTPGAPVPSLLRLALAEFTDVPEADRTTGLYYSLGITLENLRQHREAIAAFTAGLKLDPNDVGLLNRRGRIFFLDEQHDLAEQDYSRTIRATPKRLEEQVSIPQAQSLLGCIRAARNDPVAACDVVRALLTLRRQERRSEHEYLVWHNLACVFGKLSEGKVEDRAELQDLAIDLLRVAVEEARAQGKLVHQTREIKREEYFGAALRARREFQELLAL